MASTRASAAVTEQSQRDWVESSDSVLGVTSYLGEAEEAVAETIALWSSVRHSAVDADNNVVQARFTPKQARQLVKTATPASLYKAIAQMVSCPDEARSLSVCPSLAAMAIASLEYSDCARQLAGSCGTLWEIGGNCFAVLSSLLQCPVLENWEKQQVAVNLGQGAWGICAHRLDFLMSTLLHTADPAMQQAVACSVGQAIELDWHKGGRLWDAMHGKEEGKAVLKQIEWLRMPENWTTGGYSSRTESTTCPCTADFPRTPSSLGSGSPELFDSETPNFAGGPFLSLETCSHPEAPDVELFVRTPSSLGSRSPRSFDDEMPTFNVTEFPSSIYSPVFQPLPYSAVVFQPPGEMFFLPF